MSATMKKTVGDRIYQLRTEKHISQRAAAELSGVIHQGMWGNWEIGRANPGIENLCLIADFFEVSTDWILGRTENRRINV